MANGSMQLTGLAKWPLLIPFWGSGETPSKNPTKEWNLNKSKLSAFYKKRKEKKGNPFNLCVHQKFTEKKVSKNPEFSPNLRRGREKVVCLFSNIWMALSEWCYYLEKQERASKRKWYLWISDRNFRVLRNKWVLWEFCCIQFRAVFHMPHWTTTFYQFTPLNY